MYIYSIPSVEFLGAISLVLLIDSFADMCFYLEPPIMAFNQQSHYVLLHAGKKTPSGTVVDIEAEVKDAE